MQDQCDLARASLDGHVVLSRQMADAEVYPAIDIEKSVSRSMLQITEPNHQDQARMFRELYTTYEQNKDLISLGRTAKAPITKSILLLLTETR